MKKLLPIAVVSIFFTAFVINHSFERGRLQYDVDYKDVISHIDGLKRFHDLTDNSALYFIQQYLLNPPHAPLHSLQAMLSFAIFGIHDWAPYVSNIFLLFALLAGLFYVLREFGALSFAAGALFFLCTPLAYHTIEEFRPDYPSAIATVWGILLYFQFLKTSNPWLAGWAGACYGLAMLAKPPVFPYVLAMGGGPFFWGLLSGFRIDGWRGVWKGVLMAWPFFVGCAVVAGPHFLVAARKIVDYFILNQLGSDSHLWAFNEGWGQRIAYHVTGYGGWLGLGRHWILALVLWGGALAAGLKFVRTDKSTRILLGLSGMTAWAYFFLVINPHMNPFFGLTFQILLLFSGAAFLGWMVGQGKVLWKRFVFGGAVLAILGVAFCWPFDCPCGKSNSLLAPSRIRLF